MTDTRRRWDACLRLDRTLAKVEPGWAPQENFFYLLESEPLSAAAIAKAWRTALARPRQPEVVSLYVHIPFCHKKCRYCVYYSKGSPSGAEVRSYLERLHAEIDHYAPVFSGTGFDTWSIGGGTPTLLDPSDLDKLLTRMRRSFVPKKDASLEFETSPFTATAERIRVFEKHSFTRVSFGVQTFAPATLQAVRRGYQKNVHVERCMRLLLSAGFQTNLDLLYDLPGGGLERTIADARAAMELGPHSVVIYPLSTSTPDLPSLPGKASKQPFEVLASRLKDVAAKMSYKASFDWFSIRLDADSARHLPRPRFSPVAYDDVRPRPLHLLGLGPSSRCHIGGSMAYFHDSYPLTSPFSPDAPIAHGWRMTPEDEMRLYLVRSLSRFGGIKPSDFRDAFGKGFEALFAGDLRSLTRLGALSLRKGAFVRGKAARRRAAELFLLGEDIRSALERSLEARTSTRAWPAQPDLRTVLEKGIRSFAAGRQAEAVKLFQKAARLDGGRSAGAFQALAELSGGGPSWQAVEALGTSHGVDVAPLKSALARVRKLEEGSIRAFLSGDRPKAERLLKEASRFDRRSAASLGKAARSSTNLWEFWAAVPRSAVGGELDLEPLKKAMAQVTRCSRQGLQAAVRGDRTGAGRFLAKAARMDPGGVASVIQKAVSSSGSLHAVWNAVKSHPRKDILDLNPLAVALARLRVFNDEGIRAFKAGDPRAAERGFQKALKVDDRNPGALMSLGAIASSEGRLKEALGFYDRISPADMTGDVLADVSGARARLFLNMGKPKPARAVLLKALKGTGLSDAKRLELSSMLSMKPAREEADD